MYYRCRYRYNYINLADCKSNESRKDKANTDVRHEFRRRKYTYSDLQKLSTDELREISLQKAPNGCATETAYYAQKILRNRARY